jgi:hypothetical protein
MPQPTTSNLPADVRTRLARIENEYQQGELTQRGYELRRSRILSPIDMTALNFDSPSGRLNTSAVTPSPILERGNDCQGESVDEHSSAVSSSRPVSGHNSDSASVDGVDGNYVFTPPKDEDVDPFEQLDRPRLEPLDLRFQNDGNPTQKETGG